MADRPYTLLSCAMSLDGYLDDATQERLLLSTEADLDRVDSVRAGCDAIMVGATTVRVDNPRLMVRAESRRADRVAAGLPASPMKVTITARAELDACSAFFCVGEAERLVYCASGTADQARTRVGHVATVVDIGSCPTMASVSADLYRRGVRRLMVEGGCSVHTQFLEAGLADELQMVVAPFFVGDSRARRFVADGRFPWNAGRRATLADVRRLDDLVLLRYALSSRFAAGELAESSW